MNGKNPKSIKRGRRDNKTSPTTTGSQCSVLGVDFTKEKYQEKRWEGREENPGQKSKNCKGHVTKMGVITDTRTEGNG